MRRVICWRANDSVVYLSDHGINISVLSNSDHEIAQCAEIMQADEVVVISTVHSVNLLHEIIHQQEKTEKPANLMLYRPDILQITQSPVCCVNGIRSICSLRYPLASSLGILRPVRFSDKLTVCVLTGHKDWDYHPLWPLYKLCGGGLESLWFNLARELLDPRWFIDEDNVNRYSKLRRYFGLFGERQARRRAKKFLEDDTNFFASRSNSRFYHMVRCWWGYRPSVPNTSSPLYQIFVTMRSVLGSEVDALLFACRRFLYCLYHSWLNQIYALDRMAGDISRDYELFLPSDVFSAKTVKVYQDHVSTYRQRIISACLSKQSDPGA